MKENRYFSFNKINLEYHVSAISKGATVLTEVSHRRGAEG